MPLLTPTLSDAAVLLRHIHHHLGTTTCLRPVKPENRVHALTLRDADATIAVLDDLDSAAEFAATLLDGDLIALHLMLAAHHDCPECATLAEDAARIHLDLGCER